MWKETSYRPRKEKNSGLGETIACQEFLFSVQKESKQVYKNVFLIELTFMHTREHKYGNGVHTLSACVDKSNPRMVLNWVYKSTHQDEIMFDNT